MSKKIKIKRSVVFPLIMLAYLAVMAWLGRDRLERGEYLYYFGIIGVGLIIIVLLYFSLRKKEKLPPQYGDSEKTNTIRKHDILLEISSRRRYNA